MWFFCSKRGVNKKVLKVPSIEQKVLDATSNEPWGPHGSLLAHIAQATRNPNEYQIIMAVLWKRVNDTGKNWRHVYKALTVLEYLVVHGSERIIDEIREHAYQINTLSDFQYVDSSGRDQGSNVRKKSQCLVVLVNDKERIQEVRQKASTNRDKYRSMSMGSMYHHGSYSSTGVYGDRYDEDRYSGRYVSRDDNRNGYGRERERSYRDEDRYGRYGDSYGRNSDHYDREYDYGYRDSDYRGTGTSRSIDEYNYGSRSRSLGRDRDIAYADSGQHSSRVSGARAEDRPRNRSPSGRQPLRRKYSEQNLASPSYEESVGDVQSPTHSARDSETSSAPAPKSSSPHANASPSHDTRALAPEPSAGTPHAPAPENKNVDGLGEFDPHASLPAAHNAPSTSAVPEMDLLGSLFDSFSSNSLAIVPVGPLTGTSQANSSGTSNSEVTFVVNQGFDDPFGDEPFKAIPYSNGISDQTPESLRSLTQSPDVPQPVSHSIQLHSTNQNDLSIANREIDILADILPPSGLSPSVYSQSEHPVPTGQTAPHMGFPPFQYASLASFAAQPAQQSLHSSYQTAQADSQMGFSAQTSQPQSLALIPAQADQSLQTRFTAQSGQPAHLNGFPTQLGSLPLQMLQSSFRTAQADQSPQTGYTAQSGQSAYFNGFPTQVGFQASSGKIFNQNPSLYGGYNAPFGSLHAFPPSMGTQVSAGASTHDNTPNFLSHHGTAAQVPSQMAFQSSQSQPLPAPHPMQPIPSSAAASLLTSSQPANNNFETKSTIWADTLNRGLVNLNISGPKTNPLADIGVDFDAMNRKEKRMEKPTNTTVTSTVIMGQAMGSGSGIGRAGAGALRPQQTQMVSPGVGMGMNAHPGPRAAGVSMAAYRGLNQPMGMGMGMGMGMSRPMNMGIGQGMQMQQQPAGFPPGPNIAGGGYYPVHGAGNYGQLPFGGGGGGGYQ
nr:clathrin interactor EPSIN 2-like [Ipomoea batatas]